MVISNPLFLFFPFLFLFIFFFLVFYVLCLFSRRLYSVGLSNFEPRTLMLGYAPQLSGLSYRGLGHQEDIPRLKRITASIFCQGHFGPAAKSTDRVNLNLCFVKFYRIIYRKL